MDTRGQLFDEPGEADFNNLNDDAISVVLSYLPHSKNPQAIGAASSVSQRINKIARVHQYWAKKTAIHFPTVYKKHLKDKKIDWRDIFKTEFTAQYRYLDHRQKQLISAIKEGDLTAIKDLNPTMGDLKCAAFHRFASNAPFVLFTKKRSILQYFYKDIILPYYKAQHFNAGDPGRRTILYWAIWCHASIEQINFLFEHGLASIEETYLNTNETPLHMAARAGRLDVVNLLLAKGMLLNVENDNNATALHVAANWGRTTVVRDLIKKGINADNDLALGYAAKWGHLKTLEALLASGADPTVVFDKGERLLHMAAIGGDLACAQLIFDRDPDSLNMVDDNGFTPLHYAAYHGNAGFVSFLLSKGADINLKSNADCEHPNRTPIMLATDNKHGNVVSLLLDAGYNIAELVDHIILTDNKIALAWLIKTRPEHFTQACKNALLLKAAAGNKPKVLDCLITQAELTQTDNDGYLALHLAAMNNFASVQKIVALDAALVNTVYHNALAAHPDSGKTALYFAHENNQPQTFNYLSTLMSDDALLLTLHLAIQKNELSLAEKLITYKPALLTKRNADNKTALKVAEDANHPAMIDLCFKKNVFEEANPAVFCEMQSYYELNKQILDFNSSLQTHHKQDVKLMLDTQNVLSTLNSTTPTVDDKLLAVEVYKKKHHTVTGAKVALCGVAVLAISIATAVSCMIVGGLFGAIITSWSGPAAGAGALWGAMWGLSFGWKLGLGVAGAATGSFTATKLLTGDNFFTRTKQNADLEKKGRKMAEFAAENLQHRMRP